MSRTCGLITDLYPGLRDWDLMHGRGAGESSREFADV
jgi:hypothetical protein